MGLVSKAWAGHGRVVGPFHPVWVGEGGEAAAHLV